jgi:hypothetical protein
VAKTLRRFYTKHQVVYPNPADNVLGPLSPRLRCAHPPVLSPRPLFSPRVPAAAPIAARPAAAHRHAQPPGPLLQRSAAGPTGSGALRPGRAARCGAPPGTGLGCWGVCGAPLGGARGLAAGALGGAGHPTWRPRPTKTSATQRRRANTTFGAMTSSPFPLGKGDDVRGVPPAGILRCLQVQHPLPHTGHRISWWQDSQRHSLDR